MIDQLLVSQGITLGDLDAIAYGRGPGSFTGLRICLGVVQGLAFSANIPVIPVSTLKTMAVGAIRQFSLSGDDRVLVALDARMNEIYGAVYTGDTPLPSELVSEFVGAPEQLSECPQILDVPAAKLIKVGAGCHYEAVQAIDTRHEDQALLARAEDMLILADAAFAQGEFVAAEDTQPVYLRDSVAWKKRERIRR
tara:strand:- start:33991 stop:34575 length:585 start_codon:yes stop_codon:yes gene_type:complete